VFHEEVFTDFSQTYLPNPSINIDASVNVAFTADKVNALKSYVDIYTTNAPKNYSLV
jgi:hypothetical protein